MAEGEIIKLIPEKQIGFIQPDTGGEKVFFHLSWLKGINVLEGQRVQFDTEHGEKGLRARHLKVLGSIPINKATATTASTSGYHFLNPYNFIRYLAPLRPSNHVLGDCLPPPHDRYIGWTGRIMCKLKTVTPLFISDAHAIKDDDGHKAFRFFQYEGRSALPASSLRGMVRSIFEAVTNSCFGVFQEDDSYPLEHRGSSAPGMIPARVVKLDEEGALLELLDCTINVPFKISASPLMMRAGAVCRAYPPKVLVDRKNNQAFNPSQSELPEGAYDGMRVAALVTKQPVPHKSRKFSAFHATNVIPAEQHQSLVADAQHVKVFGWLHLTGPNIENKHDERLFFRWDDDLPDPAQIDQIPGYCLCKYSADVIREYNHHLRGYWERSEKTIKNLEDQRWPNSTNDMPQPSTFVEKERELRVGDLVYAIHDEQDEATMLRPVCIPRVRYKYYRQELLPEHMRHCRNHEALCPACRLFGWVREDNEDISPDKPAAYAGRVRFSHGKLTTSNGELMETTLAILSAPKPTATAFYLLDKAGQPDPMATYDTDGARLRGRKVYRHHSQAIPVEYISNEKSSQNRTVRGAISSDAMFTFTIDLENLAPLELGALLYSLELEEGMVHRLGYAKPLGFGSVEVTVEKVEAIDWAKRLESIDPNAGWQTMDGTQFKRDFIQEMHNKYGDQFDEVLADLRALLLPPALPVHYPRPTQTKQLDYHPYYEWFLGNKKRIEKVQKRKKELPPPVALALARDDQKGLPLIKKGGEEG